jgi:hypothetical protein
MGEGKASFATDETTTVAAVLLVCPQCPNRPPVRDLARHNARYHKEKKTRGTVPYAFGSSLVKQSIFVFLFGTGTQVRFQCFERCPTYF